MLVSKKRFIKGFMIVNIICGFALAVLGIIIGAKNKKIKFLKQREGFIQENCSTPVTCWNSVESHPIPHEVKGKILCWDGEDWGIISYYSSPTYSKNGKRTYYSNEIQYWGYLKTGEKENEI